MFIEVVRIYCVTMGMGAMAIFFWVVAKLVVVWQIEMYRQSQSMLHTAILVGTDVGVIVALVALLIWMPHVILTWTTTLLFYSIRSRTTSKNGATMARQISKLALLHSLKMAEIAAIIAAIATLGGLVLYNFATFSTHVMSR